MTIESNTGLNVFSSYGPRGTEDGVLSGGQVQGVGVEFEHVVYISGDDFNGTTSFDTRLTVPAGSILRSALFDVEEVFTLGNADNVFSVGTNGTEDTNGVDLAEPDALGVTEDTSGAGTWAAALAADTVVGVLVTGTTASVAAGLGKAKVVLRFAKI